MHGIKRGLAHTLYADICEHDIAILYLMLEMVAVNLHVVAVFDKTAHAMDFAHDSKPAAWDDALICKLNLDVFSYGDLWNLLFHESQ